MPQKVANLRFVLECVILIVLFTNLIMEKYLAHDGPVGILLHEVRELLTDPTARLAMATSLTFLLSGSGIWLRSIWNSAGAIANEVEEVNENPIVEPEIKD